MTTIKFENENEEQITVQQAEMLDRFYKTQVINESPKIKEDIENGIVISVIYYQDLETVEEIFAMYPSVSSFYVRNWVSLGDYIEETESAYLNGDLKLKSVSIINLDGFTIYADSRDIISNEIMEGVDKYFLVGNDPDKECIFSYDLAGNLDVIFDEYGDKWRGSEIHRKFGDEWQNMSYYHSASPIIPEIIP